MYTRRKFLILLFLSTVFVFLGAVLGLSFSNRNARRFYNDLPGGKSAPSERGENKDKSENLRGKVEPLGPSIYMQGTHKLVNSEGEILALLESKDIDLSFLEGMKVEVEGPASKTIGGDLKLVKVEKVRFR